MYTMKERLLPKLTVFTHFLDNRCCTYILNHCKDSQNIPLNMPANVTQFSQ